MIRTINFPDDAGKKFEMFRYPAGEVQVRLLEEIPHEDVIHVFATIKDGEIMALAQLIDAIAWRYQTYLFLPYLPYSRADRRFTKGDCNGLAVFGSMLDYVLRAHKVVTLDAHSSKAEQNISRLVNVSPRPLIDEVINDLDGTTRYGTSIITTVPLLPDAGASRYEFDCPVPQAEKIRDPKTGKLSGFKVPPKEEFKGDNILIIDDICDGGGTFLGIAEKLAPYGLPLYLYVTHGIFSKGLGELLKHYKRIYTTDSFQPKPHEGLTIYPCRELLLKAIGL